MMTEGFFTAGIGASAGGLKALKEFLEPIPPRTGIAFVIVTHLSRTHESKLDVILSNHTCLPVTRLSEDMPIEPDHIYVLVENTMIEIDQGIIRVRKRKEHEKVNHAVDLFLTSLASDFKDKAIGIVLSGCGSDGLEGAKALKKNGGLMIIQSPESAAFPEMPYAIATGDHPVANAIPKLLVKELLKKINQEFNG